MKGLTYPLITASALLLSSLAEAQIQLENHFFKLDLVNVENWEREGENPRPIPVEEVTRIAQASIDYWQDLLVNHYDTFNTSDKITVTLEFATLPGFQYGNAQANMLKTWAHPDYNYITGAGATILKPTISYTDNRHDTDIVMKFSNEARFDYTDSGSGVDFHTVFLHELTHGMGFYSHRYHATSETTILDQTLQTSPFDNLITDALNGATLELGQKLEFGDTGLYVYNPEKGDPGSSFSHVAPEGSGVDSLMRPSFESKEVLRHLSEGDIAIFNAMGYDLVYIPAPEPSSVALILIITPALLLRRRRKL